jgi:Protein of unknown function (DUF2511)
MRRMPAWLTVALAAIAVAGCDGSADDPPRLVGFVSEATWPDEPYPSSGPWPFSVAEGILTCHAPHRVTFAADRVEYALNGAARSTGQFQDINAILRDAGPDYIEINGTRQAIKSSVGPMVVRGLDLCP